MRNQITVDAALQSYIGRVSLREPDVLRELREETSALSAHLMQVPPEQGQFLRLLIAATGARRSLEIGVFTGYSLLSAALALPPDGSVVALEINEVWCELALHYCRRAGVADKVDIRVGDATQSLAALVAEDGAAGSFDFAFIDANKDSYLQYYEDALELLRPGGLMVIDNVLWHGAVTEAAGEDPEIRSLQELNARLHHDERIELSMLPFADGITLAVKR
jgi:predicted O-methyltransferase YrrM